MEKMILLNLENDGFRYKYEFEKDKSTKDSFFAFLNELGFKETIKWDLSDFEQSFEQDLASVNFDEISRHLIYLKNKDFDVEILFGEKKIIFFIRTTKNTKLINLIEKYTRFKEIVVKKGMANKKYYKHLKKVESKDN